MNKHQFFAIASAIIGIFTSFAIWTNAINGIPLPTVSDDAVAVFEDIIDTIFPTQKSEQLMTRVQEGTVFVRNVRVEELGTHFVASVERSHVRASVVPQEDRSVATLPQKEEEVAPPPPAEPIQKEEAMAEQDPIKVKEENQPTQEPMHAAPRSELAEWELSPAWNITIPKLGIRAPVFLPSMKYWGTQAWDMLEEQMQVGLNHGAVAYPHSAGPGRKGSLIVAGHSSPPDERSEQSAFGHLFAKLPTIAVGEQITVETAGTPVTYEVQEKIVVSPKTTSILEQQYDESTLKLITCYPVGTTRDRMIVLARKVES